MYLKKFFICFFLLCLTALKMYGYADIRAENNAYRHNNKGLIYLKDKYYFGAIKEFQIAIDLMPNAQGSSAYYINLATTYEKIGYPELALSNYEKVLKLHPLYFDYYLKLAQCYKRLNLADKMLKEYQEKPYNPLNDIMIGLLYIQTGQKSTGITLLDNFCNDEPYLIVTSGVREYLDKIVKYDN